MAGLLGTAARRALSQAACSSAASTSGPAWVRQWGRSFSAAPEEEAQQQQQGDAGSIGNERVQRLADEIVGLSVLECSWLSEILRKRLNMERPAFGAMPMMGAMPAMGVPGGAPGAGASGSGGDAPAAEAAKEKTEFAVKLEAFSAEGKIKVIKEIRAITSLGLKEAKELVRSGARDAFWPRMLRMLRACAPRRRLHLAPPRRADPRMRDRRRLVPLPGAWPTLTPFPPPPRPPPPPGLGGRLKRRPWSSRRASAKRTQRRCRSSSRAVSGRAAAQAAGRASGQPGGWGQPPAGPVIEGWAGAGAG